MRRVAVGGSSGGAPPRAGPLPRLRSGGGAATWSGSRGASLPGERRRSRRSALCAFVRQRFMLSPLFTVSRSCLARTPAAPLLDTTLCAGSARRLLGRPGAQQLRLLLAPGRRSAALQQAARQRRGRGGPGLVRAVYGWPVDGPLKALMEVRAKLKPLAAALRTLWEGQRRWLQHTLARLAVWAALLAGLATAAANVWAVPAINRRVMPAAAQQAAAILQREVGALAPWLWHLPSAAFQRWRCVIASSSGRGRAHTAQRC